MNFKVAGLLAILAIGVSFTPMIFADELEYHRGLDYSITQNEDGSYTRTLGLPPFIDNGFEFVEYLHYESQDAICIETNHGSICLAKETCGFSYFNKGIVNEPVFDNDGIITGFQNDVPLFSDSIVPLMANNGTMDYDIINSINNQSCESSWDGSELLATKQNANVGILEYAYILDGGKWKTELRATNLSSQTDKQFGFTQTIDLNRDTISYGGSQKNLDNLDDTTFDRAWLENNNGKVIDLLNGFYFDFDLGFDNLYQVNVFDTGNDKSKLSFDYVYNQSVILPTETLIIDPSINDIVADDTTSVIDADGESDECDEGTNFNTPDIWFLSFGAPLSASCYIFAVEWDISDIPDGAEITDVDMTYDVDVVSNPLACQYHQMNTKPSTNTVAGVYAEIDGGTIYQADTGCLTTGNDKTKDLGASADTKLSASLSNDWFGVGVRFQNMTNDAIAHQVTLSDYRLSVTYNLAPDPPKQVTGVLSSTSPYSFAINHTTGEDNGNTHQTFDFARHNGVSWVILANKAGENYTDNTPLDNSTAKYRVRDVGNNGANCWQSVLNGTITTNMLLHFPLCLTTNDSAPTDNDGIVTGSELYNENAGDIFFNFTGSTKITSVHPNGTDITNGITIALTYDHVTTDDTTNNYLIYAYNGSSGISLLEKPLASPSKMEFSVFDNGNQMRIRTPTVMANNTVIHVVATTNGSVANSTIYFDGVAQTSSGTIDDYVHTGDWFGLDFVIGSTGSSAYNNNGIRDVIYTNYFCDQHCVDQLYNGEIDTVDDIAVNISALSIDVIGNVANATYSTKLTEGFPTPTIDYKQLIIGAEQRANNTDQPLVLDEFIYQTFWFEMESGLYNMYARSIFENDVESKTKTTATIIGVQQEYDPFEFVADTPSLGYVNYTIDATDPVNRLLKINRPYSNVSDSWTTNCRAVTGFNDAGLTWYNQSGIGAYKETLDHGTGENVYIACYNPDEILFSTVSYGNLTGILAGFSGFDDQLGSWFGLPMIFMFVFFIAGLFGGRQSGTSMVITLAVIAILGGIGLIVIDEALWGIILVLGALGLFASRVRF